MRAYVCVGKGSFHTHTHAHNTTQSLQIRQQQSDMNKNTKSKIKICNRKLIPNPITKLMRLLVEHNAHTRMVQIQNEKKFRT